MTEFGSFPTSYFSAPAPELDPTLFEGRKLRSWVRQGVRHILTDFLNKRYRHPELWAHPWLAGSAVSYQWQAARQPGDLDCLIGVDYIQFRKANPEFKGLTEKEISEQLNEEFKAELYPQTDNWNGFELTFYVNPGATDIRTIKPYAAYDLKYDEWTVHPDPQQIPAVNEDWERVIGSDKDSTKQIYTRFNQARQDLKQSLSEPNRRNAEARLAAAYQQAEALFHEIHSNRSSAFSTSGEGYNDFSNYRWQAGKREGVIQTLREVREYMENIQTEQDKTKYGVEFPDASTLIRRAATYRAK
jgi:hypothetical protein